MRDRDLNMFLSEIKEIEPGTPFIELGQQYAERLGSCKGFMQVISIKLDAIISTK